MVGCLRWTSALVGFMHFFSGCTLPASLYQFDFFFIIILSFAIMFAFPHYIMQTLVCVSFCDISKALLFLSCSFHGAYSNENVWLFFLVKNHCCLSFVNIFLWSFELNTRENNETWIKSKQCSTDWNGHNHEIKTKT